MKNIKTIFIALTVSGIFFNLGFAAESTNTAKETSNTGLSVWVSHTHNNASGSQPNLQFSGDVKTESVFIQLNNQTWTSGFALSHSRSSFSTPFTRGTRGESSDSFIPYLVWRPTTLMSFNGYLGVSEGESNTLQSPMGPVTGSRDFRATLWGIGGSFHIPVARGLITPTLQYASSDAKYDAYSEKRTFDDGNVTLFPRPANRVETETLSYGARYELGVGKWLPYAGLMKFNRLSTSITDEARHWMQSTIGLRYLLTQSAQIGLEHKHLHQHQWEKGSQWAFTANYSW